MVNWDAAAHEQLLFAIIDCLDVKLTGENLEKLNQRLGCSGTAIPQHISKLKKKRASEAKAAPKVTSSAKSPKRSAPKVSDDDEAEPPREPASKKKRAAGNKGGAAAKNAKKDDGAKGEGDADDDVGVKFEAEA